MSIREQQQQAEHIERFRAALNLQIAIMQRNPRLHALDAEQMTLNAIRRMWKATADDALFLHNEHNEVECEHCVDARIGYFCNECHNTKVQPASEDAVDVLFEMNSEELGAAATRAASREILCPDCMGTGLDPTWGDGKQSCRICWGVGRVDRPVMPGDADGRVLGTPPHDDRK